ncbi:O-antigen ligase family protein [Devosia sp. ZB163]|uniref:O-antigen ligase family protein n=1 Tax=Devosia sp. ZB163 TaxID=3025938 RepID=UPI002362F9B8|nr:O-antigen ligase family protein [Devosia sp. ZB163]MDC9824651.1 O-antigen ligase family protein [Devosia sp. ZB163]
MTILVETRPAISSTPSPRAWSRQSQLNNVLAYALIVFVALAPVPFGSHRPFFWAVNAAIVGAIGSIYLWRLGRLGEQPHRRLASYWPSAVLYVGIGLWLVIQALPAGILGPLADGVRPYLAVVTRSGASIAVGSISVAPDATLLMLLRWATYGMFYFLVLQIASNERRRELILHAVLAIATFYAMFGLGSLLQFGDTILGLKKWTYEGSATATFVNRNSFATFLAFGAVVAVSLICGSFVSRTDETGSLSGRRFDPVVLLYLVALAAIVAALLATQSRMGTFAATVGCVVVALTGISRMRGLWARALLLLPLLVGVLGLAVYVFGQNLVDRLGSLESSADVRLDLYAQVIEMIMARPWIGYGGGSFELAYPLFHQLPVSPDLVWDRAHNSYLALFAELGVVAGGAVLVLLGLALVRVLSRLAKARAEWPARAAALGVIIVAAVHSLVDFSLEIQANTILFLLIVGLGAMDARKPR